MASIRLGELLVKAKIITEVQLRAALGEQQKWGGKLGEILVRMNMLTEDMLVRAVSKQLNVSSVDVDQLTSVPPHVRSKIPVDLARDLGALPIQLKDEGRTLVVAMSEPQNVKHVDAIRSVCRLKVLPQIAGRQAIAKAFGRIYEAELNGMEEAAEEFKVVDSHGHTIVKSIDSVKPPQASAATPVPARAERPAPVAQRAPSSPAPARPVASMGPNAAVRNPTELLRVIEDAQRKEVGTLKALVDMLIQKGVFTREEYLAKVKR